MSNSNADLGTTLYKDIIQKLLDNNTSAMQTQILTEKEKAGRIESLGYPVLYL